MKFSFSILMILTAFCHTLQAQSPSNKNSKAAEAFVAVEQMPEFPGGSHALMQFFADSIRYPEIALDSDYSGRCLVKFIVDSTGLIRNAEVVKGIPQCPGCNREALRVVNLMPRWKPGKQNGKTVNVYYTVPVSFRQR